MPTPTLSARRTPLAAIDETNAIRSLSEQQESRRARYSDCLAKFSRVVEDARDAQVMLEMAPLIATAALQVPVSMLVLLEPDGESFRVASGVGLVPGEQLGACIAAVPGTLPGYMLVHGEAITVEDCRDESRFRVAPACLRAGIVSELAVPLYSRGRLAGTLSVRSPEARRFGDEEKRFLGSLSSLLSTGLQRVQGGCERQFTAGIAHDVNNLLTVVQGNIQALEELPALAPHAVARQLAGAAAKASRSAAELTRKLLPSAGRQAKPATAVAPAVLLHSLADMLRRTLDQGIRIEVTTLPDCPALLAEAVQLESALLNLAINARDAMPRGGTLSFSAEPCRELPASVRVELEDPGVPHEHFVVLKVSDTGEGMPADVRERAFEPLFTTKDAGRGTGLGLSTVHAFVQQSRGAIAIESAPGLGTTMLLYMPRARRMDTHAPSR